MVGMWTEHRNAEGRTYWFNTATKESVWEKPDDLKSPFEKALGQTQWKEYFSGGRKYYYNTDTKESKWDMPDELLLLLEKVEKEKADQPASTSSSSTTNAAAPAANSRLAAPSFTPSTTGPSQIPLQPGAAVPFPMALGAPMPVQELSLVGLNGFGTPSAPTPTSNSALPFSNQSGILPARPNLGDDPAIPHNGFATIEEGEKAFTHLLRKAGVDATWTWDQTMRAIITDPLYKALNSLAEKKSCWQKYVDNLKAKEQEEKEARLSKLRPALRNMLKGNPNVFHYTTFQTADKLFAQHPIWQQAKIEAERKLIFEEYVAELKQREVQESRAIRARSVNKVMSLFKQLGVDVLTRWRQAHTMLLDSDEWKDDDELQTLPTLDILLAFEDYSRVREREFDEQTRRAQVEKTRKERKAREAFKELLKELVDAGKIKAKSKWKDVYPSFSTDERYLNILGNPGSNPLELFWDVVDAFDQKFDIKVALAEDAIREYNLKHHPNGSSLTEEDDKEKYKDRDGDYDMDGDKEKEKEKKAEAGFVFGPGTAQKEFIKIVRESEDKEVQRLTEQDLKNIYDYLRSEALRKQEAERRRAERKQRHMQDDLRYAMKKLADPIDLDASYEEIVPLIEQLPEFKALEDEGRRAAFAKYIKRAKERLREREASEDGASTTSRRRREPSVRDHKDRDYDKDKDRDSHRDRDHERDRDRDKDRDRDRDRDRERERERERDRDKDKDHEKDKEERSSRHHHRDRDSDRDHGRERDRDRDRAREKDRDREKDKDRDRERDKDRERDRDKDRDRERDKDKDRDRNREKDRDRERERDRDGYRSSRHQDKDRDRERDKSERDRDRDDRKRSRSRHADKEWDHVPRAVNRDSGRSDKDRHSEREHRERSVARSERSAKRVKYDRESTIEPAPSVGPSSAVERAETPEEGEI